jgi:hypothetical protein
VRIVAPHRITNPRENEPSACVKFAGLFTVRGQVGWIMLGARTCGLAPPKA